jgi:hypothetical protein
VRLSVSPSAGLVFQYLHHRLDQHNVIYGIAFSATHDPGIGTQIPTNTAMGELGELGELASVRPFAFVLDTHNSGISGILKLVGTSPS